MRDESMAEAGKEHTCLSENEYTKQDKWQDIQKGMIFSLRGIVWLK
jgi:hypothetical protein